MPFEAGKNSTQLGIDTTRDFIVVEGGGVYKIGTILSLVLDDGSYEPKFKTINSEEDGWFVSWHRLEYASNNKKINIKTMIKQLSSAYKRFLTPELQAQFKAGLRNGELSLTDLGKNELLEILAVEKNKELTAKANELIAEEEKKS